MLLPASLSSGYLLTSSSCLRSFFRKRGYFWDWGTKQEGRNLPPFCSRNTRGANRRQDDGKVRKGPLKERTVKKDKKRTPPPNDPQLYERLRRSREGSNPIVSLWTEPISASLPSYSSYSSSGGGGGRRIILSFSSSRERRRKAVGCCSLLSLFPPLPSTKQARIGLRRRPALSRCLRLRLRGPQPSKEALSISLVVEADQSESV